MVNVPPLRDADSQLPLTGENTTGVAVTARLLGAMVTDWVWLAGGFPPIEYENARWFTAVVTPQGLIVSHEPPCTLSTAKRGEGLVNPSKPLSIEKVPPPGSGAKLRATLLFKYKVPSMLLFAAYAT